MTLGPTKQLFLDDWLIESQTNVTRRVHPAEKSPDNPVLWPREPWEGNVAIIYGSVIRDGDRYRMWYHGGSGSEMPSIGTPSPEKSVRIRLALPTAVSSPPSTMLKWMTRER